MEGRSTATGLFVVAVFLLVALSLFGLVCLGCADCAISASAGAAPLVVPFGLLGMCVCFMASVLREVTEWFWFPLWLLLVVCFLAYVFVCGTDLKFSAVLVPFFLPVLWPCYMVLTSGLSLFILSLFCNVLDVAAFCRWVFGVLCGLALWFGTLLGLGRCVSSLGSLFRWSAGPFVLWLALASLARIL
ncbi:hypothetical protein [Pacificibacter marinus]|uniref:hypothetical protein n=1 Tax=Pacificibacter marinus TaxID=658057 RepID=UPI0008C4B1E2|nr:hypothetical protein [Pacificibacter marinus]SEK54595.1 hypothetical protein SAMN04488032_103256 [Pacificibacter marinus]